MQTPTNSELITALENCVRDMTASHIVDKILYDRQHNPQNFYGKPSLPKHKSLIEAEQLLARIYVKQLTSYLL